MSAKVQNQKRSLQNDAKDEKSRTHSKIHKRITAVKHIKEMSSVLFHDHLTFGANSSRYMFPILIGSHI